MERIDFFDTILDLLVKSMYDNGFITHCVCDETVVDVGNIISDDDKNDEEQLADIQVTE